MFKLIKEKLGRSKKLAKKQPKSLHYEELEQRVLFSADIMPGLDSLAVEEQVLVEDIANDVKIEREIAPVEIEQTAAEQRWELVLVSENVADYEQLIADLQGSDNKRIIEVVVLESDRDGIEQVSDILAERSDLAAVHFITHGADGQINLGDTWLDSTILQQNSDAVAGWGSALTETGDILFYGCNIAADSDGQSLLDNIASITGTDVAASDDRTGSAALGGDWELEFTVGAIETSVAVGAEMQDNWSGVLVTATNVGTVADKSAAHTQTQLTVDASGVSAGNTVIIAIALNFSNGEDAIVPTVTDSQGNTYNTDIDVFPDGTSARLAIISAYITTPLTIGDTITVTHAPSAASTMSVQEVSGLLSSGALDQTASSSGASPTASSGSTATTSQANELVFGATLVKGPVTETFTEGGTYTLIGRDGTTGASANSNRTINPEYKIVSSTGTYAADGTLGTSSTWIAAVATYKLAPAGNDAPVITSDGGGANATVNVVENTTAVTTVTATDADAGDTLTYSINLVSADADKFNIDSSTGVLTFKSAPDFENPTDVGLNNVYDVTVQVSDGNGGTDSQAISVTVTNSVELFIVTNTADSGVGSLRQAILDANANANSGGPDVITFNIDADGSQQTIILDNALPPISEAVIIDGFSQYGALTPTVPLIELNGGGTIDDGLSFASTSDGSVVQGLMVTGFSRYGIQVDSGADGITILGNWIGTTGTGYIGVGNWTGINIQGANTIIGGTGANDGNVITNNTNEGINVTGVGATGTIIQGNIIGLDPDGASGSGNADVGIALLSGANSTTIGGSTAAARNIISNNYEGIEINSNNNTVQGNYIGTDAGGTLDRGNRSDDGVEIQSGATGNIIGGTADGAGNLIAFNARDGVYVASGSGNAVLGNRIHSNAGLGIDLGTNGVTANDISGTPPVPLHDADSGPNNLQNFPVLTTADIDSATALTIDGTLNTDGLNQDYRIEFFRNKIATGQDPSTYGEGEDYLGFITVTTDGSGNATFSTTLTATVAVGEFITATATVDLGGGNYGNTSEFALNLNAAVINDVPTGVNDSASTDQDTVLSAAAPGVLGNDTDDNVGGGSPTAGHTLNFDAGVESDTTNNVWESEDPTATHNWTFNGWGTESTYSSSPTTSLAGITGTYQFTGTSSGGTTPTYADLPGDPTKESASFELWFRPNTLVGQQMLFESGGNGGTGTAIYLDGSNLRFFTTNQSNNFEVVVDLNTLGLGDPTTEFIQVVGVIDLVGDHIELFVNGQSVGSDVYTEVDWAGTNVSGLGTVNGTSAAGSGSLNGDLAIFRFYESALTPAEVTVNYQAVASGPLQVTEVNGVAANVGNQITLASGALLTMNADGSYSYDPNGQFDYLGAGDSTTDSFTYTLADGGGLTDTATVTITINGINDAPTISAIANQTITEDGTTGALAFTVSDIETADGSLTVTATSSNTTLIPNGNLTLVDLGSGSWTIEATPAANQNGGPVTITVTVDDGTTTTDETFDVTITADNDAPTITAIADQTIAEDGTTGALAFTVGDVETAAGSLTVTANSSNTTIIPNGNLTLVDLGSGSWTIEATPALDQNGGPVTITVTVDDGTTTTDETFDITVTPDNDAPTITAIADQTIAEDGTTGALAFTVSDVETAAGSLTVTANSSNTTIIPNGNLTLVDLGSGSWTIEATPALDQNGGPVTITVTVDDGTTTTDETFDVTVTADNDAPTITAIADQTIAEDGTTGALAFTVGDVETAAGSLTVTASSNNTTIIPNGNLTLVDLGSGSWTIEATPALDQNGGPVTITVTVDDGTTTTDETFDVTITADNDAPTITAIADQTIAEDGTTGALAFTVGDVETAAGSLTVSATSSNTTIIPNGNLTLVDLGSGNWTIEATPALDQNGGPVTITVTVDDGTTTTDETFDVTVTADNDAPTITAIADQAIAEDGTTGALAFTVGDVETAAGSLTVTATSSNTTIIPNGNLTLVDLGSGSWTIEATPALDQNGGPVTITVTVDDGTTTTDETFDVTVTADNDAPTITAIADQTIAEDGTTGALAFSVGDVETAAGSLTVTASSNNTTIIPNGNLTLVDLGSGSWTIEATPALDQNGGPVTITVTVDDGTTTTDETFDITVTPDNDAPTITAIADQTIAEDGTTGALAFSVGDVETAAGSLTVSATSSNTTIIPNGNLTLVDLGSGSWTIEATPALDQNGGPVTITVTVDDGTTTTDETFDVTVTPDNDAPTITAIADQTIAEDGTTGALAFTVSDVETAAGSLTVTANSSNTTIIPNGNLTLVDLGSGNWTIEATPALDQNGGPVTITVTVDDGTTTTDETFDITVTPDNDAPTITAIADQTIAEDGTTGALAFTVGDVETSAGSLTVTASSSNTTIIPNGNLTLVDLGSGNWTIEATPALDQNGGPVTITVTVDDGTTTTDETFDITVTPDNDAPTITAIADQTIAEDGTTGALAFTVGDVETAAGSLTVTASSSNTTIIPNGNLTLVDLGSGSWTIEATPALDQNGGPVTITVTVDDGTTTTDETFDITVTPDNDAPTITAIADQTIAEDGTTGALAFTVSDVETAAGSLTVTANSSNTTIIPNGNLTLVDLGSGSWTIEATPALDQNGGPVTITVTVDDGTTTTDETFDITVTPDNDAPTITAIADQTIAEDGTTGALAFTVSDVETAAGSLTVTANSSNTTIIPNGNLTLVDLGSGSWTIEATPALDQNGGPVTITVTVDDGTTTTDETFDITVTPDNDAPTITAIADQTIAEEGTTGALAFTVSDVETAAGSLTVTATSSNTTIIPNGNLTLVDLGSGNWTIEATPALDQNGGPVTITVTVDDGTTTTDETFDVTVTADNDAPTITAIADQAIAEDGTTGALAFTVGDVETAAGSLTVTATSSNTTIIPNGNLTLVDLGSGSWTIEATPALDQNGGPVTITVTVDDGTTTTDETFDVTVTADNDAPTITAIADQTIAEDGTTGALAFSVGDVETAAGSLTVTASSNNTTIIPNGNLTLVDLGSGSWTIEATPALDQNGGPVTITVTVDDGTTTTDETFDITVTPDNDAPTITAIADQTIAEDGTTGALAFTVGDVETAAGSLTVTASSSNTTIIPNGNLTLVDLGSGSWTIEATPALDQNGGPVTITVTVDDGTTTTDETFDVTVTADNDAPTITAIADQTIAEDGTTGALAFSVGDVETAAGSLTVTASSNNTTIIPNGNLTLVDLGSGSWTIEATPALDQNGGPVTITVTVDDGTTTTDETFDVTVTADNDAPTITAIADQTIAEDGTTGALAFSVGDVETAAGSLTVTASSNNTTIIPNGNLTLVDLGSGNWTIEATPALDQNGGPVTITVTVDDGTTTTDETFDVTVTADNDAPTITAIADQAIAEDGTTGALAFTVGDVETAAGSLTVTATSSNTTIIPNGNLTLVDLGSGSWTIEATPALDQNGGPVTITVTVDDGTTTTDETFDVTVTADNDAPTITAIADQTIAEDGTTGALAFSVGDVETAAGSLTVTASSNNTTIIPNGNLTLVDLGSGSWTIEATPALDQNGGPVTITVTVDDGTTTTDETFDITVTPDNDAPTISAIADQTIAEDGTTGALAFSVGDVETAAGSLTVTASSSNTTIIPNGNLTLVDLGSGSWTIEATPALDQNGGPVTITVTVDDGTTTADETFDVTITADNDAPTITAIADQTIAEDGTTGALAFSVGDVETAAGSLTVTASSSNTTIIPNGNLTLVDLGSGSWTIEATPALDQNGGPVTITVTVDDGTTTTDETFDITVTPDNDAPTITAIADQTIAEDGTTGALAFTVSDVETAAGSLTVTANSSNTTIIPNGNLTLVDLGSGSWTIEATPALDQNGGPVTITVTVDDGTTTTDETFDVTITAVNDAPTISAIANQTIAEDGTTGALAFSVSDVETTDGSLTVTATSNNTTIIPNGNLTLVDLGSGNWTIEATPALNQNGGPVTITVTVDDGTTTTDETFTVTVTADNDAPTISAIANQTIAEDGTTGALALSVSDVETADGSLTVTATSNNTTLIPNGNLTLVDLGSGNWTIEATPAANQNGGPVTITVTVDDGTTTTDETFTVTVTAVNDVPVATANTVTTTEDNAYSFSSADFTFSDVESDSLVSATITNLSLAGGTLTHSGGTVVNNGDTLTAAQLDTLIYTPAANANGSPLATFDFTVNDIGAGTVSAQMGINVTPVNDAPTTSPVTLTAIAEDSGARTITQAELISNAVDVEGDGLTATGLTISAGAGTLVDNGDGTWNYTPAANDDNAVSFSYNITDGTDTVAGSATLDITPINDAPTTSPVTLTAIAEDSGVRTITQAELLANAGDVEGDGLTATWLTISAGNGTLVDNGDGTWNYTPAANDDTGVSFSYSITDGTDTVAGSATLDTTPVNDAPAVTSSALTTATEDVAYSYTVTTGDVDGDPLTITAPSLPAWLSLVDNGDGTATLSGTPTHAEVGDHSVVLQVSDSAATGTQNFTLNVAGATIDPDAVFELTDTDDGQDPAVEVPSYEDPAADPAPDPVIESAQVPPVEKLSTPRDSSDADDQLVDIQDPAAEEAQEIILLTEEIDTGIQSDGRDDDRSDIYFDNDLYKDMRLSKYLDFNYKAAENALPASSADDFSLLDFNSDDPSLVEVNDDYDLLRQEIDESFDTELKSQSVRAKIVTVTTASFTIGIVSYLLRAGSLVASLMSSLPLWRGFDPIAIFSGEKKKKKDRKKIPDTAELKAEKFFDGEAK